MLTLKDIRRAVTLMKKQERPQEILIPVDPRALTKWLSIIWKGQMVQINGKGKIRRKRKSK